MCRSLYMFAFLLIVFTPQHGYSQVVTSKQERLVRDLQEEAIQEAVFRSLLKEYPYQPQIYFIAPVPEPEMLQKLSAFTGTREGMRKRLNRLSSKAPIKWREESTLFLHPSRFKTEQDALSVRDIKTGAEGLCLYIQKITWLNDRKVHVDWYIAASRRGGLGGTYEVIREKNGWKVLKAIKDKYYRS